jgi:hypothetical protein
MASTCIVVNFCTMVNLTTPIYQYNMLYIKSSLMTYDEFIKNTKFTERVLISALIDVT